MNIICPHCGGAGDMMIPYGTVYSPIEDRKIKRWGCLNCGKTTLRPLKLGDIRKQSQLSERAKKRGRPRGSPKKKDSKESS